MKDKNFFKTIGIAIVAMALLTLIGSVLVDIVAVNAQTLLK